ncbi:MAG: flippase [Chloroflexi bacterium]|nr:flippase [Chloroflexota bacterium]
MRNALTANPTRRLALNTAAPMAARLVDAAFAVVYLRLLGRADVGAFTFLVVLTTYLDTLVDFGLNALIARDVSRGSVSARAAFRSVNLLRLALWLVGLPVVLVVYGPLQGQAELSSEAALAGWLFYAALLPTVLAKTATGVLWSQERLDLSAAVQVLTTLLKTALGVVVLFAGFGVIGLAGASLATNVVTAAVLWWLSVRAIHDESLTETHAPPLVMWLREGWPLFVNQLLQGLFFKIDALLLLPLAGDVAAGTYAAAYKVSEGAGIISSSFTLALFPRLSRQGQDLSGAYRMALRVLLQIALPLAVGTALLSAPIVALVGGREYLPDSATALAILICYLPLSYANGLTQYVLIAAGKQRLLTGAFAAALVFNLFANLLLIPRFSYVGAAWVTVASEVVLLVPFRMAVRRVTTDVSLVQEVRTPLLATLLMAPVVWWLRDAVHPLVAIPAGAAIYAAGLWALGGIDASQRRLLLQFVRP